MYYFYCRVSTLKQRYGLERQKENILKWFVEHRVEQAKSGIDIPNEYEIVEERCTGTKMHRPKWDRLFRKLQQGDSVVFDSVSRMSRAEEGIEIYMQLYDMGVNLFFVKEPLINTITYRKSLQSQINIQTEGMDEKTSRLICGLEKTLNEYIKDLAKEQIQLAFEQSRHEVKILQTRTKEGLRVAKQQGKKLGVHRGEKIITFKSLEMKVKILKYCQSFGGKMNDTETINQLKIHRNTFYKYKKELIQALDEVNWNIETVKKNLKTELSVKQENRRKYLREEASHNE